MATEANQAGRAPVGSGTHPLKGFLLPPHVLPAIPVAQVPLAAKFKVLVAAVQQVEDDADLTEAEYTTLHGSPKIGSALRFQRSQARDVEALVVA